MNSYSTPGDLIESRTNLTDEDVQKVAKEWMDDPNVARFEVIKQPVVPKFENRSKKKRKK